MADKTIADLTLKTTVEATDLFEIENSGGNSRRVTGEAIRAFVKPNAYEAGPANVPVLADFSWLNQGTSTASDSATGIAIGVDIDSEMHILLANNAPPAAPYDIYMRAEIVNLAALPTTASNLQAAIILRDATNGDFVAAATIDFRVSSDEQNLYFFQIRRWNSPTSSGTELLINYASQPVKWIRVNVTSTTVTLYVSGDGLNWIGLGTEAIADFVGTIDSVGIGVRGVSGSAGTVVVNQFGYSAPTV